MARSEVRALVIVCVTLLQFCLVSGFAQDALPPSRPASVPGVITFNGISRDQNGQPVNGVVGVTFALYKDQQGGTPLWIENQNVPFDSVGRYSALLGATQPAGVPAELFTAGDARWLGVQIQLPGEQEQPRVFLVSVPYALKAGDADTIGGRPASAFVLADSESTSVTKTSSSSLTKAGDDATVSAVSGTGSTNRSVKWTDASGALGDGSIQDLGTGVGLAITAANYLGIGTTNPISKLHVQDTNGNFFVDASPAAGGDLNFVFQNTTAGGRQYSFRNLSSGRLAFRDDTAGLERMSITNAGYVGIGTPNPISRLHLSDTNGNFFVDGSPAAGNDLNFVFQNTKPGGRQFSFRSLGTSGRLDFRDDTAGVERMSFDGAGNVGIGTTAPSVKLDVAGNARASQLVSTATTGTPPILVNSTTQVPNLNASLLGGATASAALTRGITYLAGCDTCSTLADTDNQKAIYYNVVGTMTINSITCFTDSGAPIINIQRDTGAGQPANVLAANLPCTTGGATSTNLSLTTLNLNEKLDFAINAAGGNATAGGAKRITVAIKATVN